MRIKITAGGIFDGEGKEVPVGSYFTVKDEPTGWAGRYEIVADDAEPKAKGGKKAVTNPGKDPITYEAKAKGGKKAVTNPGKDPITYEAKAKGEEWFIFDTDGKEQGAALSEADATAFNGLSDEDKAAFVVEHAKA
jgi:hypothetical protein